MWFVAYHEGFQPLNTHEVYQPQVKKMARKGAEFAGLSVSITTPIVNGEVDYETLKRQVEFHVEAGTTCLCPVGTTGESPTLSHDEHERVIAEVVQAAAGRIKVMAGTGSKSRRRCRIDGGAGLHQANAGRFLRALQSSG